MMDQEWFADGISAVHLTGNLVRMDLMTLQPQLQSADGQPVVNIGKRLIMPLDGFVQSLAVQQDLVRQLIAAGIVKENQAEQRSEGIEPI